MKQKEKYWQDFGFEKSNPTFSAFQNKYRYSRGSLQQGKTEKAETLFPPSDYVVLQIFKPYAYCCRGGEKDMENKHDFYRKIP